MLPYPNIDPIAIHLGPIAIRWYGISYVVSILLAWWLLKVRARKPGSGWNDEQVADLIFYCAVGLILGGRLGSVLFYNFPYYLAEPLAIFKIWEGGMSFHGGLIGGFTAAWLFARHNGKRFAAVSDYLAPVVPVGLGFGRIGNFINAELWGKPTDLPWAMVFPHSDGLPRHPSQLYEAALEGLVLFVILWLYSSRPRASLKVTGLFLLLYGVFRSAVEIVREPDAHIGYLTGGWLTMGQVLCLPMIGLGAWLLVRKGQTQ